MDTLMHVEPPTQAILTKLREHLKVLDMDQSYVYQIAVFLRWCAQQHVNYAQITLDQLYAFLAAQREGRKNSTLNNYIKALRYFYQFLREFNLCSPEAAAEVLKVKRLKEHQAMRVFLTYEELTDLIRDAQSWIECVNPYKTKALLLFMYDTGLRRDEIVRLTREKIDLVKKCAINTNTKSGLDHLVYLRGETVEALDQYFRNEAEDTNAFNMTRGKLQYFFQKLSEISPSGKHLHPHVMRHTFGFALRRNHVDLLNAQALLGHKSVSSTLRYFHGTPETVEADYRAKMDQPVKKPRRK